MSFKLTQVLRNLNKGQPNKFFVTTPIYYVNAKPHIGHLYSSVIADAAYRWRNLCNPGGLFKFSTGTDEHGSKIQQAANFNKTTPLEYCNKISANYQDLARRFHVDFTDFIRTTDEKHQKTVHKFWDVLKSKGHIYSANYNGWYCVSDECFLTESQLKETVLPDGKKILTSIESGHPVEWTEELNYMFPLHQFQDDLKYWIKQDRTVMPKKFQKIIADIVDGDALPAISISRPSSRVHWGIPVPNDRTQTVYVWLDALVNYLTVAGYGDDQEQFQKLWPPDLQIIGKDILKFHAIYWPAFLIAAGLEPPYSIFCHSHWTVDGEKMSKSKNNVICPIQRSEIYTEDGLRYFLLREGVAHNDGNYSDTKVVRILNSELADTFGNLLSRCCGNSLNPHRIFPSIEPDTFNRIVQQQDTAKILIEMLNELPNYCCDCYNDSNFYKVVDRIIAILHQTNLFFETMKPWELRKRQASHELNTVLHLTLETLRVSAILLQPIIPKLCKNLLERLQIPEAHRYFDNIKPFSFENRDFKTIQLLDDKSILFKRLIRKNNEPVVEKIKN